MTVKQRLITKKIKLAKNEVHLWSTKPQELLKEPGSDLLEEKYRLLLTDDETIKQQRYKFDKDRHDALITRAFVRDLLSYYTDVAPVDWRFEKGEKDKPEIIDPPIPLRFNISHTKDLIICVVTLTDDIGCDVENTTRNNDVLSIADRFFSSSETKELFSLPKDQQRHRFFDYWTLKESYIKAWGLGLAIPLKDFSFTINPAIKNEPNGEITLNFAKHRIDNPNIWRSWLFYPNSKHRIAISLRSSTNNQACDYSFRFFNSVPLVSCQEFTCLS
ncbi:MAG: 4'-phosphopantetheinyl transferase superfamily protein [Colwellia sp.]|nr:4'-phosphopantetheinyl transferase superfamily protein [Colwellia sp.]